MSGLIAYTDMPYFHRPSHKLYSSPNCPLNSIILFVDSIINHRISYPIATVYFVSPFKAITSYQQFLSR